MKSSKSFMATTAISTLALVGLGSGVYLASAQDLAGGAQGGELSIDGFVGTIEIREGSSFSYDLAMNGNVVPEPAIQSNGNSMVVHGGLEEGPKRCQHNDRKFEMQMKGGDRHPITDFPTLIITVPSGTDMSLDILGGQVEAGDSRRLDLSFKGCGDVEFGNVAQDLILAIYGSGDVTGGSSGPAEITIKGSGDVEMDDLRGPANIAIMGSGDVTIGEIQGQSRLEIKGSGDIEIESITAGSDIDLRGSGDVEIARGDVKEFKVNVRGSGDVTFNGGADDVSVLLKGSGDVYVARSNGNRSVSRYGSGDVRIGSWRYDDD